MVDLYHRICNKLVIYISFTYYNSRNALPPVLEFFYPTLQVRVLTKENKVLHCLIVSSFHKPWNSVSNKSSSELAIPLATLDSRVFTTELWRKTEACPPQMPLL